MQATDAEDIEEALRADPDDPAGWRAYGDWLSEHGDARGELIALEQRLARLRPVDRPKARREIADFVAEHEGNWDDGLPSGARVIGRRHGFPTAVAVDWSDEAHDTVEQVLRSRFVTTLRIQPDAATEADAWCEEWGDWYDGNAPRPAQLAAQFAGLDLGRLGELDLRYMYIGHTGAEDLASLLVSDRLRTLDLRYCLVEDSGLTALAACPQLRGLRGLHLQRNRLTAEGVHQLHQFPELRELDLRYNDIGEDGAQALLDAPFVGSLARLWLYSVDVGDKGVQRLAQASALPPGLRSLWRCV
ncbi:MAG TPA: TIGR02996 domain-containing protein [Actinocrinis sp.]|jgi:uncharacterized protein (TIGR02996 family)